MARYTKRADGRYCTSVKDHITEDGKLVRRALYGKTIAELDAKVREYELRGYRPMSYSLTVTEYSRMWLSTYKSVKSINTRAMYNNLVEKHIVPVLGEIKMSDLLPTDIQKLINGRKEKSETCKKILMTMKQIVKIAINDGILTKDVCVGIELPKNVRKEKRPLTDLELMAIDRAELKPADRLLVNTLLCFGVRRGEALALMKSDFDFKKNELNVWRTVEFNDNDPILSDTTKTEHGVRHIPIPPSYIAYFKDAISRVDFKVSYSNRKRAIFLALFFLEKNFYFLKKGVDKCHTIEYTKVIIKKGATK